MTKYVVNKTKVVIKSFSNRIQFVSQNYEKFDKFKTAQPSFSPFS